MRFLERAKPRPPSAIGVVKLDKSVGRNIERRECFVVEWGSKAQIYFLDGPIIDLGHRTDCPHAVLLACCFVHSLRRKVVVIQLLIHTFRWIRLAKGGRVVTTTRYYIVMTAMTGGTTVDNSTAADVNGANITIIAVPRSFGVQFQRSKQRQFEGIHYRWSEPGLRFRLP